MVDLKDINIDNFPEAGEPLKLADGTVIESEQGSVVGGATNPAYTRIPTHTEIQNSIAEGEKTIIDLPLEGKKMNAISLTAMYAMYGLSNEAIAEKLNVPIDIVINLQAQEAYTTLYNEVVDRIISHDADNVRGILSDASVDAAKNMTYLMHNADSDAVQMKASADILDRAGHRPNDIIEHRLSGMDELPIRVIIEDKAKNKELDAIDVEFETL